MHLALVVLPSTARILGPHVELNLSLTVLFRSEFRLLFTVALECGSHHIVSDIFLRKLCFRPHGSK